MVNKARGTRESLSNSIFSPDPERPVSINITGEKNDAKLDREVVVYTVFGSHHAMEEEGQHEYPVLYDVKYEDGQIEYAEDSAKAYAKVVYVRGKPTYYVKASSDGSLYSPHGLYEGAGRDPNRKRLGRAEWEFEVVKEVPFLLYRDFLRTGLMP